MGKLVRDAIPDIIRADGRDPAVRVLSAAEFEAALLDKLVEEAEELRAAPPQQQLGEAGDVYEVLRTLAELLGVDMAAVAAEADRKRVERGGFEQRIWLDAW